ncbi:MAG TPA: DUF4142 domain-containing protein [Burkholderiales bacterium]|nr:DUF4142 domain-containing protein [Burkholderiales bacterium]
MTLVARTLAALVLVASGMSGYAGEAKLTSNDRHFITEAAEDGHGAVELGRLAQRNASSAEVKFFAQMLVDDHARVGRELDKIGAALGVNVPKEPGTRRAGDANKLAKLAGSEFDREFADHMVREHEKAAALYEKQATRGDAEELKAFAARVLPMLREHLRLARALAGRK